LLKGVPKSSIEVTGNTVVDTLDIADLVVILVRHKEFKNLNLQNMLDFS